MPSPNADVRMGARRPTLRPLAAAFAIALAMETTSFATMPAEAAARPRQPQAIVVSNCDDNGAGSLRDAVTSAVDGDTIDLTQLSCSVISLSTGAILMGVSDLTLQGPGGNQLLIQGVGGSGAGILYDFGGGTLTVEGVDIAFGAKYRSDQGAHGGCIYSNGNVAVSDSHVYACGVHANTYPASGGAIYAYGFVTMSNVTVDTCGLTTTGPAKGGGVFAGGDVIMRYSTVSGCRNATNGHGYGGGVFAGGDLTVKYSTISNNENDEADLGLGGGAYSRGNVSIYWSTISGNSAEVGGGLYMGHNSYAPTANISESTISGNYAQSAGGVRASLPLKLYSSTIAFNNKPRAYTIPFGYAPTAGLSLRGSPVTITSSIIANNVAYGVTNEEEDVGGDVPITIAGSNNLIMSSEQPTPGDTITADPMLAPLAANGGLTLTHALMTGSPAINHGIPGTFDYDQRGPGFTRVQNGVADIGAFEVDPDRIFSNGFD
jgi:hypothetical protein